MQGKYMYMDRYFYSKATAPGPHQSYIFVGSNMQIIMNEKYDRNAKN